MTTTRRSPALPWRQTSQRSIDGVRRANTTDGEAIITIPPKHNQKVFRAHQDRRANHSGASKVVQFVLSASGSAALIVGMGVFAADALGTDPTRILSTNIPADSLRKACKDYQHQMAEHNESNPLFTHADELTEAETYRKWVRDGWHLSRDFLARAGIAIAADTNADSDNAHTAILDAVAKCYAAGVNFGAYDEYGDYAEGIGRRHGPATQPRPST